MKVIIKKSSMALFSIKKDPDPHLYLVEDRQNFIDNTNGDPMIASIRNFSLLS